MPPPPVTLTTDFGTQDGYAACLHGVLLTLCPTVRVVDVTHAVPPQDIAAGAAVLARIWEAFPPGTIHLAVVDPGVGSTRRGLAVLVRERVYVGPDNGLLDAVLAGAAPTEARVLSNPAYFRPAVSATFHGRDVFAPVAAHLANGVALAALGPPAGELVRLPPLPLVVTPVALRGAVAAVDRFGNLRTTIPGATLHAWLAGRRAWVTVGGVTIAGLTACYADAAPGELLALVDSDGYLEVACHDGDAAHVLGLARGAAVVVRTGA